MNSRSKNESSEASREHSPGPRRHLLAGLTAGLLLGLPALAVLLLLESLDRRSAMIIASIVAGEGFLAVLLTSIGMSLVTRVVQEGRFRSRRLMMAAGVGGGGAILSGAVVLVFWDRLGVRVTTGLVVGACVLTVVGAIALLLQLLGWLKQSRRYSLDKPARVAGWLAGVLLLVTLGSAFIAPPPLSASHRPRDRRRSRTRGRSSRRDRSSHSVPLDGCREDGSPSR